MLYKNIQIKALPIFRNLQLNDLPLNNAWTITLNKEFAKKEFNTILISPFNQAAAYGIDIDKFAMSLVLLVTDERRHKFPELNLNELKTANNFPRKTKCVVEREKAVLEDRRNYFIADSNGIISDLETLFELKIRDRTGIEYIESQPDECPLIPKERIVLFLGRSDRRKGLQVFLDMFENSKSEMQDWHFIAATTMGDDRRTFKRANTIAKYNSNFDVLSKVSEEMKHDLFNRSSIFIFPSFYESFGITALEAMQHGCVVISSRVGGIPEVVANSGILCQPGDIQEYSSALGAVIRDEKTLSKLSNAARIESVNVKNPISLENTIINLLNQSMA